MIEDAQTFAFERVRARTLELYTAVSVLMLIGIGVLIVYSIRLGTLVGQGVETSFGIAVALMFLQGGLVAHLVDRTYRVWPLGRRVHPQPPGPVSEASIASALKVVVIVAAGAAIAYLLGTLIAG